MQVVIESTGLFTDADKANPKSSYGHITAGAKKVIISAPAKNEDITVVMGVNHEKYDPAKHNVISNASCTTNCLAPLVHVLLKEGFGIEEGLMTTIHAIPPRKRPWTVPSKKDWKGGRSAAINMIPSTTGAAKAVGAGLPGSERQADRHVVPRADADGLGRRFDGQDGEGHELRGNRGGDEEGQRDVSQGNSGIHRGRSGEHGFHPLPQSSSIFDEGSGIELNKRFFKLVSWYDNEWGYSCRVGDLLKFMIQKGI